MEMKGNDELISLKDAKEEVKVAITRLALMHLSFSKIIVEEFGKEKGKELILKAIVEYEGREFDVSALELCDYGTKADYEAFADAEIELDLNAICERLSKEDYEVKEVSDLTAFFRKGKVFFTLHNDGRLIMEGIVPGSQKQAIEVAIEVVGYNEIT